MMNFAALPTDNSFGNQPTSTSALINALYQSYQNNKSQNDALQQQQINKQLSSLGLDESGQVKTDPEQVKALMSYRPSEANVPNPFDIARANALNAESARKADIMKYLTGNSGNQSSPNNNSGIPSNNYQVPTDNTSNLQVPTSNSMPMNSNNESMFDRADNLWNTNPMVRKDLEDMGLSGKQQLFNNSNTGEVVRAITLPSGKMSYEAVKVGESPEKMAFEKEKGRGQAEQYNTASSQNLQLNQNRIAINDLVNTLQDPDLKNVVGPTGQSFFTKFTGTEHQKELLGRVQADSGVIFTDLMNSMRGTGSVSDKEGAQFLKMKPNTGDSPQVMMGKLKASELANQFTTHRNNAFLNYMDQGKSSNEALQMAQNDVSFADVSHMVDHLVAGDQQFTFPDGSVKWVPYSKFNEAVKMRGKWNEQ
jgi:hypothetical protein